MNVKKQMIMKANDMNYKKLVLICAIVFAGFTTKAQIYSEKSRMVKSFKVTTSTTVEVFNKYGKLHIVAWQKDSVKFDVDLLIKSSSMSKLEKLKDNISFDFTGTEYYITAKSVFGNKYSGFFKDLADFAEALITSDNQVEINYTIFVPEYVNMKINNKFGDIYIEDMIGDIGISLSNGDLKAGNFEGNTNIELIMGDGEIKSVKNGKIYTTYSDLNINKAGQLNLDSRTSKINIDQAEIVRIESKKDKIYINSLQQLFGEAYFSDIWVYNLDSKVNFNMKYGNINMETIKKEFRFIDLKSEYTDVNMFFQSGSTYNLDITTKNSYLRIPHDIAEVKKDVINESDNEFYTYGNVGKGPYDSKLKIIAVKGSINIFHK